MSETNAVTTREAITVANNYQQDARLIRSIGMDVEDGLAFTFSCADYPEWIRKMNGWAVEDAAANARAIAAHPPRS